MMGGQGQAGDAVQVLAPVSAANTAAATSGWIDVRKYEGDLTIIVNSGAITGTCTITVNDATDGSGTSSAAVTPNEGAPAVINSANQVRKFTINASAVRGWIQVVGTVVTGPVLISYTLQAHPKYTTNFG